jgi:hypothetical protein
MPNFFTAKSPSSVKKRGTAGPVTAISRKLYSVQKSSISNWVKSLIDEGYITVELVYAEGKPNIDKRKIFLTHQIPVPQKQPVLPDETAAMKGGGQNNDQGGQKTRKKILQLINTNSEEAAAAADQSPPEIEKPPPETAAAENSAQGIKKLKAHFSSLSRLLLFDEWFIRKSLNTFSKTSSVLILSHGCTNTVSGKNRKTSQITFFIFFCSPGSLNCSKLPGRRRPQPGRMSLFPARFAAPFIPIRTKIALSAGSFLPMRQIRRKFIIAKRCS